MDINFVTNSITGLFLLYLIILGNFSGELLNCRIQELFTEVAIAKHVIIFFTIYYFINLTSPEENNPIHNLYKSAFMHLIFIISRDLPILHTLIILFIMFVIKFLDDYKRFHYKNKNHPTYKLLSKIKIGLSIIIFIILITGFIQYTKFEFKSHKKNWSWRKYLIGLNRNKPCNSLTDNKILGRRNSSLPNISNLRNLYK